MAFTLDSTLGSIIDDPRAKAVLDQVMPGASTNPMVGMARGMSLNMIMNMPQASQMGFTREKAEALILQLNQFG